MTIMLEKLDPALIWSAERMEGCRAVFFQNAVGMRRADGSRAEYEHTNMLLAGTMPFPFRFERRELRIYPFDCSGVMALRRVCTDRYIHPSRKRWGDGKIEFPHLCDYAGLGDGRKIKIPPDKPVHVPLPWPAPSKRTGTSHFWNQAASLVRRINAAELPCIRTELPFTFEPCMVMMSELVALRPDLGKTEFLAVQIGSLYIPIHQEQEIEG
jgi:hypothetical protein